MKVGVDTNILISSYYFNSMTANQTLQLSEKCFELCISDIVIAETLSYSIFKSESRSNTDIRKMYDFITTFTFELYEYKNQVKHKTVNIRDEKDTKVLVSAIEAGCDIFVTGDKDFFECKYDGIQIMTPRQFIDKFQDYL
ncbi:hypothetical protein FACS1894166_01470 [Bacilli bacterium]|nr:hypothetical protein FACS1894166_01470 [Bacilli bacterium]